MNAFYSIFFCNWALLASYSHHSILLRASAVISPSLHSFTLLRSLLSVASDVHSCFSSRFAPFVHLSTFQSSSIIPVLHTGQVSSPQQTQVSNKDSVVLLWTLCNLFPATEQREHSESWETQFICTLRIRDSGHAHLSHSTWSLMFNDRRWSGFSQTCTVTKWSKVAIKWSLLY